MNSMNDRNVTRKLSRDPRIVLARIACMCLGAAMIIWGLTPAVLDRILTGRFPSLSSFMAGSFALLIGLLFIYMQSQFDRTRWALSIVNIVALVMMFVSTTATIMFDAYRVALFPMVLASFATFSTWLALTAQPGESGAVPPLTDAADRRNPNAD